MGVVCQKGGKSQMVGLWGMFTVKYKNLFCKNQNKKNFYKKICTISLFFKLVNFPKGAIFS